MMLISFNITAIHDQNMNFSEADSIISNECIPFMVYNAPKIWFNGVHLATSPF